MRKRETLKDERQKEVRKVEERGSTFHSRSWLKVAHNPTDDEIFVRFLNREEVLKIGFRSAEVRGISGVEKLVHMIQVICEVSGAPSPAEAVPTLHSINIEDTTLELVLRGAVGASLDGKLSEVLPRERCALVERRWGARG
jgi:hypothetical protein